MKNGIDFSQAYAQTPTPAETWIKMEPELRIKVCQELLDHCKFELDVIATNNRGEVIVSFHKLLSSAERGTILLDAENVLKRYDPALVVYLQAKEDRNALRKLRGVIINDNRR